MTQGGMLKPFIAAVVTTVFLLGSGALDAGPAFFSRELKGVVSIQSLPLGHSTLKEFYFADTTTLEDAGYIPMTAGLGMGCVLFYGYVHTHGKLIFETSMGGSGEGFWGLGGAIALEVHPFRDALYDPYLLLDFGYINMPGGGYDGEGYHVDVGAGLTLPVKPTFKVSPFIAYTPVSQWMRKKQVGYMLVDPIIGPEPAYEGRICSHSGFRVGISVLFNLFASEN